MAVRGSRGAHRSPSRRAGALAVAAAVLLLAGCGPAVRDGEPSGRTVAGRTTTRTIDVDGRARTYHLYVPASVGGATAVPLVVVLHGGFGSGTQAEDAYGWDAEADGGQFAVAYPDGLDRAWNTGGGCCGTPGRTGVDDVGFVVRMVGDIGRRLPVDQRRVFATGISNGGMLAYRLACDTTVFAAVGPDSATLLGRCPLPAPVSVVHIHGTADHNVPYLGGPGDGPGRVDGPPVPDVVAGWRGVDGCAPPATTSSGAVTTSVASCPGGRSVELVTIAGAGHQWPGGAYSLGQRLLGLDRPSTVLSATDTIWRFFAAHPRPAGG